MKKGFFVAHLMMMVYPFKKIRYVGAHRLNRHYQVGQRFNFTIMKKLYKLSVRSTILGIPIYVKVEYVSLKERNHRYKVHTQFIANGCNGYSHVEENSITTYYNIFKKSVFYYECKHE